MPMSLAMRYGAFARSPQERRSFLVNLRPIYRLASSRNRMREMTGRYLFRAGRKDHPFEVLEIRPEGLRLLVPRRTVLAAWGAVLAIAYYVGSQLLLSAML